MLKSNGKIYLDYAAGVVSNPSSIHVLGVKAKNDLQSARNEVASILGARSSEIIFTSGGTESNNLAIQGVVLSWYEKMKAVPHIITTNIEHPSVLKTFEILKKRKLAEISIVPVEKNGIVDSKKIKKEIKENTILVSVMYANNEIGTIQPIKEIAKEIRYYKKIHQKAFLNGLAGVGDPGNRGPEKKLSGEFLVPLLHTDAVQAANYLDLNVERLGVDLLSLSGSKIEGAGKVGVLYKKKLVGLSAIFGGGDQEMGLRPGTEDLQEIIKFSKALKFVQNNKDKESKRLIKLRDYFIKKLQTLDVWEKFPDVQRLDAILNGDLKERLPNNINITFPEIPSDLIVVELSEKGVMASSKSACESSQRGGSYVIQAIHPELDPEIGGVRFSLGRDTTKADIDCTIKFLSQILLKLKKWYTP
ncbi:MAG: cysteine desulfurase family protein [Candidatus Paceibacterota bacterium]